MTDDTSRLFRIFGLDKEPGFSAANGNVSPLLKRLVTDDNDNFLITASTPKRTRKSIPALALLAQFMMKDALADEAVSLDDVYLLFLTTLFIFALDDYLDTQLDPRTTTVGEVDLFLQDVLHAARTGEVRRDDRLVLYISDLIGRLARYPSYKVYAPTFDRSLEGMLKGMLSEFANRDPRLTNLDEYMSYAAHSVGITLGLTVSLIVSGDDTLAARPDELAMTFDIVASIIRYSNDIRSYERETRQGKFSSLLLAAQKFGIDLDQIHERVNQHDILRIIRAMILAEVYDLRDCMTYLRSLDGNFERTVINVVTGIVMIYEQADFHEFVLPHTS